MRQLPVEPMFCSVLLSAAGLIVDCHMLEMIKGYRSNGGEHNLLVLSARVISAGIRCIQNMLCLHFFVPIFFPDS